MSYRKVLAEGRCRFCPSTTNLMRYFLIPGNEKAENTIPVCLDCLAKGITPLGETTLRQEEVAYVLKRKGETYLTTLRTGG